MNLLFCVLLGCLLSGVTAQWSDYSSLRIIKPLDIAGSLTELPALFGVPNYQRTIKGQVAYFDGDACKGLDASFLPSSPTLPLVFLLNREPTTCSFVAKVRNAQNFGAAAVIIASHEEDLPFMVDDGTGHDVTIPSMIIGPADATKIKEKLVADALVEVQMKFFVPAPDNRIEMEIWSSPNDASTAEFKKQFDTAAQVFGPMLQTTPRFTILDGDTEECRDPELPEEDKQACQSQCSNERRYCYPDPDWDPSPGQGLNGRQVVEESLRQICLREYLEARNLTHLWWGYEIAFQAMCSDKYTEVCSYKQMEEMSIDVNAINSCVEASGGTSSDVVNQKLKAEIDDRLRYVGNSGRSMILINKTPYFGSLVCPDPLSVSTCGVLAMACEGFADKPSACRTSDGCRFGQTRDVCGVCDGAGMIDACGLCISIYNPSFNKTCLDCAGVPNGGKTVDVCGICGGNSKPENCTVAAKGFPVWAAVLLLLLLTSAIGGGVFVFMKKRQEAMRSDIDSLLRQYLPLEAESSLKSPADKQSLIAPNL